MTSLPASRPSRTGPRIGVKVVPTLLAFLIEKGEDAAAEDLSAFRHFICGAGPLSVGLAASFEARFKQSGFRPEPGLGAAIVELSGNLPYDVQRLAHETWDDVKVAGRRTVGLEALHATLRRLLAEYDTLFEQTWQGLTLAQRATLRAAVLEDGRSLLSADARARYRLSGTSTVQAALAALERHEILMREGDRYVIVDSLLREWVARTTF